MWSRMGPTESAAAIRWHEGKETAGHNKTANRAAALTGPAGLVAKQTRVDGLGGVGVNLQPPVLETGCGILIQRRAGTVPGTVG